MSGLLADVRHLAGTIGPRGTGTAAERAAAEYVSSRAAGIGLHPTLHPFRTVPSQNAFPIAVSLVALASVVAYPLGSSAARWVAALLALASAWSLWQTIRSAFNPIRALIPKVGSLNVEARLPARGNPRHRAVLLAHLDTNRCRLVWQSLSVRLLEPMTWLTLAIPTLMGVVYLTGALLGGSAWWWLSLPLAGYQVGVLITLLRDDRTPYSPGAHDNAASVAVALEVAERLAADPLPNTEVWFVFDGAEETDHAGVLDLLRRHGAELRSAAFLGLEGLGSGEIVYLTRQGLCVGYGPTADLLALAETAAARHPEFEFRPARMIAEDDVRPLRERGYHALTIAGRDPETGILPRWHRPDDTPEAVSEPTMRRAADIVCACLKALDESESERGV